MAFHLAPDAVPGGFLGVTVFFVLSGYLITKLLLQEHDETGGIDIRAFYIRRFLRLYPALMVALALALILAVVIHNVGDTLVGSATAALYITDLTEPAGLRPGLLGHTWSLGVEEQFYLFWPLLLAPLVSTRRRSLHRICLMAAGAFAVATALTYSLLGRNLYFLPLAHIPALLLGAALASTTVRSTRVAPSSAIPSIVGAVAAVVLVLMVVHIPGPFAVELYRGGWLIVACASLAVLWASSLRVPLRRLLGLRPLAWLGRRSYGVYLFSAPLTEVVKDKMGGSVSARGMTILALTLALSTLSYRYVERPFLRLKVRFQPLARSAEYPS